MLSDENIEEKLIKFYRSNRSYFRRIEKAHGEKYYEPVLRVMKENKVILKGKKVLDVGSGTGSFLKVLGDVFGNNFEAVGTDISPIGEKFHQEKGIGFILADAHKLPFKNENFDVVFSIDTFEHLIAPQRAIGEMYRVTKSGGFILVRTRNYHSPLVTGNLLSIVELGRDFFSGKKDLTRTKRLKPIFSSRGGDEDAVSAIFADQLKLSLGKLQGEILVFETWTKGGAWKILNRLPIINLLGSMCLVLFKKA